MMGKKRKPTIEEVKEYLEKYNPLDLADAQVSLINEHNHLHYRLEKDRWIYCLRMINPETYRAGEWLPIGEEHKLLWLLEQTKLAPKSFFLDEKNFLVPLIIQEYVDNAVCFNEIKTLSKQQLESTARAIALLNSQNITPKNFNFKRIRSTYKNPSWLYRLWRIKLSGRKDVKEWTKKIEGVIKKAKVIFREEKWLLKKSDFVFNFDAAHCGNTYWKDDNTFFLDWQKVSYGDPSFTLARFITSIGEKGKIDESVKEIMIKAYLERRDVPYFWRLVENRISERLVSDLLWVVYHYVREKKTKPVEEATSVVARYNYLRRCYSL